MYLNAGLQGGSKSRQIGQAGVNSIHKTVMENRQSGCACVCVGACVWENTFLFVHCPVSLTQQPTSKKSTRINLGIIVE